MYDWPGSRISSITYIWTHNGDLIQTGHLQDLGYREPILIPLRKVVSKPVGNIPSRAGEGASSDDKSTLVRTSGSHSVVRASRHLSSVCVVRVILGPATVVNQVSVSSTIGEGRACAVLDHVRRTDELAVGQASALVLATARAGLASMLPAAAGFTETTLTPLALVRVPSASTAATTTLVQGVLGYSDFTFGTLARVASCEVRLQTGREARDRGIWAVSDRRCLWRVAVCFGKGFRCCVVTGVRAVVEVCGLESCVSDIS
jgi:hypothetical protein